MDATELMMLYQGGDIDAFTCLYGRYKGKVYGYLRKRLHRSADADEIFQEVFLRLHHSRYRYKREFPFEPWLFTVLRNTLVDHYRKSQKEFANVSLEDLDVPPAALHSNDRHSPDPLVAVDTKLPFQQRRAIELRFGKDFSFADIAAALDTTPANARQLVSRAIKKLRQCIRKNEDR
ncbi:MAG: RNA polymerase sigma factor [Desulfobulbaceae bacterium]|nr:RNA polymerase sigma factor [Desulfobulbaceae bacterium]